TQDGSRGESSSNDVAASNSEPGALEDGELEDGELGKDEPRPVPQLSPTIRANNPHPEIATSGSERQPALDAGPRAAEDLDEQPVAGGPAAFAPPSAGGGRNLFYELAKISEAQIATDSSSPGPAADHGTAVKSPRP